MIALELGKNSHVKRTALSGFCLTVSWTLFHALFPNTGSLICTKADVHCAAARRITFLRQSCEHFTDGRFSLEIEFQTCITRKLLIIKQSHFLSLCVANPVAFEVVNQRNTNCTYNCSIIERRNFPRWQSQGNFFGWVREAPLWITIKKLITITISIKNDLISFSKYAPTACSYIHIYRPNTELPIRNNPHLQEFNARHWIALD